MMRVCRKRAFSMEKRMLLVQAVFLGMIAVASAHESAGYWGNHGGGLNNRRSAFFEKKISPKSVVNKLKLHWSVNTTLDVTATPAIGGGVVYFPDWDGNLYAVNSKTGAIVWARKLGDIAAGVPEIANAHILDSVFGLTNVFSRTTPVLAGNLLVVSLINPCTVVGLNRFNGDLVWWTTLDTHPFAIITMSGTYYDGAIYLGTSSEESSYTLYGLNVTRCCNFQGALFKLNARTGKILWRIGMLPDNGRQYGKYSGAAVWGSSPAIDPVRKLVYVGTGNTYSVPAEVDSCEEKYQNQTIPPSPDPCLSPDAHNEAVVAVNIETGKLVWAAHLGGYDVWILFCGDPAVVPPGIITPGPGNCPKHPGGDYDFGEAPMLLTVKDLRPHAKPGSKRDILVIGQKSGYVWGLDRDTGERIWATAAGPGGTDGGAIWGMTTDGERVFTNIVNGGFRGSHNFTLLPSHQVIKWGGWVALDASSGKILWSTAGPTNQETSPPLSHANGVVFGGAVGILSEGILGTLVALDAKTGSILWSYGTPGVLYGGWSISQGCGFVGIGGSSPVLAYPRTSSVHGRKTLAFCVKG